MVDVFVENTAFSAFWFFAFGALVGSFLNVVIYRLPAGKSVVSPRSACGSCGKLIKWYDNLPILSWLLLRGKCRNCKASFSIRYPFVELLTASVFMGLFLYVGWSYVLIEYLLFSAALIAASFIDLDHMILPDKITLSGIVLGLVGAAINPERAFLDAFAGVLLGGGFLWAIAYIYYIWRKEDGMGGGDIKLLAWIGAILGWKAVPFVILTSSLLGTFVGIVVMTKTKGGMKTSIPFGPYLAMAALIFLFGGSAAADWYISQFIPSVVP